MPQKDFKKLLNLYENFYEIYGDQNTTWGLDDLDEMHKTGQEFTDIFAVNFEK